MVEAGAKEIPEAEILDALDIAHSEIKKLVALQRELAEKAGKEKKVVEAPQVDEGLLGQIKSSHGAALDAATQVEDKLDRQTATKAVEEEVIAQYSGDEADEAYAEKRAAAQMAFDKLEKATIRDRIAVQKKRPDGRAADEIREISIEVGVAPRTHGSALFTRGQTQAFSVAALGTLKEEMRLDTLGLETKKYYFHHYNFPGFSVGEAGPMRGPKRRDIGPRRARRARPRADGALDRGVPVHDPRGLGHLRVQRLVVHGLGVRLLARADGRRRADQAPGGRHRDGPDQGGRRLHRPLRHRGRGGPPRRHGLQGRRHVRGHHRPADGHQDHRRDLRHPARRARPGQEGRTFILGKMAEVIDTPRSELSQYAPRIQQISIDPQKIGLLIGKGGETIRGLQEEFESQIDVNDDGTVLVYAANGQLGDALIERIRSMTKEVEVGDEFPGAKVVKTTTFGAFVELAKGTDGLLHISNVSPGQRWRRSRRCSTRATRSRCAWSRSTRSAAVSACASLTTRTSRASPSRSSPRWAPATRAAPGATEATAARADRGAAASATAAATAIATGGPGARCATPTARPDAHHQR